MKRILTAMTVVVPLLLAACGGATTGGAQLDLSDMDGGGGGGGGQPGGDITRNAAGVVTTSEFAPRTSQAVLLTTRDRIQSDQNIGRPFGVATGFATYAGGLLADTTIDGQAGNVLFANIDAQANLGTGTFSGTVRNFSLANSALQTEERINGTLSFDGSSNGFDKSVTAVASGNLTGAFGDNDVETVTLNMNLDGLTRGPGTFNNMTHITGSVGGGTTSNQAISVSLDGDFYLRDDLAP